jgi:hypothetical protein
VDVAAEAAGVVVVGAEELGVGRGEGDELSA